MYELNTAFCNNCFYQIRPKDKLHPQGDENKAPLASTGKKSILRSMKDSLSSAVI